MASKYYVKTKFLEPGMQVAKTVSDRLDRIIAKTGDILDEKKIEAIKTHGIPGVTIIDGSKIVAKSEQTKDVQVRESVQKIIDQQRVDDPATVQLSESVKKRVSEGIQYLYSNSDSEEFAATSTNITNELMRAILDNNALAIDISTLKTSDEYTFKHSVDVATLAMITAQKMNLSQQEIYNIGIAGLLHDMGKSKIPLDILNKPGKLTDEEFAIMKRHSELGYHILKDKKEFSPVVPISVLQHHEKINGSGYPLGINKDKLLPFSRILTICDTYDALVTDRPYKKAYSQRVAVEIIMSMTNELDIDVMKSFFETVILYPVDSVVQLSNGETARVIENKSGAVLRPTVVGLKSGIVYNLSSDLSCASIVIL